MKDLQIVKIGGNVIDDPLELNLFLNGFHSLPGLKILVHGGGKIATSLGIQLGIESKYIAGRRITDDDTIDLVTMVYGGLVNKKLVAALQAAGTNAIGLSGADANVLPARKRPVTTVDYGWVGDVSEADIPVPAWHSLLEAGLVPVVAPLTHDGGGHILNTNADTIASSIAVALSSSYHVSLMYCFEKPGILLDVNDPASVISSLNRESYLSLKKEDRLFAGILPKIENALAAVEAGVERVVIGHARELKAMAAGKAGTRIGL